MRTSLVLRLIAIALVAGAAGNLLIPNVTGEDDCCTCDEQVQRSDRTSSVTLENLVPEDRNLNEAQVKQLRVTWEKPRRITTDKRIRSAELQISGRLSLLETDGKTLKPVDWPLSISIVLCRFPGKKPDWTLRHDSEGSLWSETLVGQDLIIGLQSTPGGGTKPIPMPKHPAGVFVASFQLGEIHSPIGEDGSFQVGLCLGEKKGKTLTWRNVAPIIPQTVQVLVVTGPARLSRTLQLINACPTPIGWEFDPIALVRATNHLQSLGKDKTIESLRMFLDLASDTGYTRLRTDPANIDTSNQWCLASLVPLVFEGIDGEEQIQVWRGIPFHTVVISGTSGWPQSTRHLVEDAALSGKLIKQPMRPTDDPLDAADTLFKKLGMPGDRFGGRSLQEHLRGQAWRAIRHLVSPGRTTEPDFRSQATWNNLKATASRLGVRWDEQKQEYIGEKTPK